jgi:hypothetical protein
MTRHWTDALVALDACSDAVEWARGYATLDAAWAACDRGDWLLWYVGRISGPSESVSRRRVVMAACACAHTALHLVPSGEYRPRVAIETAERWARGDASCSLDDVRAAAWDAAWAAAGDAGDAAGAAAWAAAWGVGDAGDAAGAAAWAAWAAAGDAGDAAGAAAWAAARDAALLRCAEIVREHYPTPPNMEVVI